MVSLLWSSTAGCGLEELCGSRVCVGGTYGSLSALFSAGVVVGVKRTGLIVLVW